MQKWLFGTALALCATGALAQPALTPEQALNRRTIGELEFSPDGSRLAFTVAEPAKGTARTRAIWPLDVSTGRSRQLTFSGKNDAAPRWAPNGSAIAFTSDRDGAAQLYLLPLAGGEAERVTDTKERVESFRWSPDGLRIALLMNEPKSEAQQKREREKDDSRVIDKDARHARVWMLDVASKRLTQVTSGSWEIGQIEWLPDGRRLVAVATDRPAIDQFNDRLYTVDTSDGSFHELTATRAPLGGVAVSPDGRTVAYVGARVDGPLPHDLYVVPTTGGAATNVTSAKLDRPIGQPRWIDNRTLSFAVQRGFKSALATIAGGAPQIDELGQNPSAYARAGNGTLAYVGETATRAPELYIKTAAGAARPVTTFNEHWAALPVIAPEFLTFKSVDGVDIEAALLEPSNRAQRSSDGRLPLIVLVHGGPTGRWADSFEAWGQLLAARGYAVLYPNVRGSTGYGQKFVEMNRADWGGGDFKDVMAGVDAMIARGLADPNRLGIGGWSYGGYMAAWAVTQTTRFKAAVSGAPVIDMASEFGTEIGSAYDEWFYGTPYEKLDGFIKSSPITFVKNVRTPTLLLQGDADETDPIGQSQQFYRGLKRYHVESDFVVYPREPHGFREEKHLVDRLNRILAWYDKYLKPAPSTAQP